VVVGDGAPIDVPAVAGEPVRRVAGKRATPRRSRPYWLDEAWWNEPADLSRFDAMTERETLQVLYAEWQVLKAKILTEIAVDQEPNNRP